MRTFTELKELQTLAERFEYLKIGGSVGAETFGRERWLNQAFYRSREWKAARDEVIVRDMGMDLGTLDTPVRGAIYIHHMNPIRIEDFDRDPALLLDPEYLISTGLRTHNAIHYGDLSLLPTPWEPRRPGDTRGY